MQFTYLSLDDFRIVFGHLNGNGNRTTENRGAIPYTTFLDPPFSRIGDSEAQARFKGYHIRVMTLPAAAIPKGKRMTIRFSEPTSSAPNITKSSIL